MESKIILKNKRDNKNGIIVKSENSKTVCGDCWGSGWEIQFVKPCEKCNGTGVKN